MFYRSKGTKGFNRKALEVWSRLGSGDYNDGDYDGIAETVSLLSEMPDERMMWRFF
eukprot:TRINITY_DN15130_c0_g1_i1.p3 TRINITY_DN15130_c0_g1~~TRINITY_DN15130_c0_g1_i1.p3  ORF type:complete len:56 (-),score=8.30 TRINITY_DN15130_c0_g1_i1:456-623(-)